MFAARYGLIPYIQQITFHLLKVNFHHAANFNLNIFKKFWVEYPHTGLYREKDKEKHGLNGATFLLCSVFLCLKNLFFCFYLSLISHAYCFHPFILSILSLESPPFSLALFCCLFFVFVLILYYVILKAVPLLLVYPFYCAVYPYFLYFLCISVFSFISDFTIFVLNTV